MSSKKIHIVIYFDSHYNNIFLQISDIHCFSCYFEQKYGITSEY
jgi:hypothetical protein